MGQMKPHLSLPGFITGLLFVTAASEGCDGPSAPQCFRRYSKQTMYICEWRSPYKSWRHCVRVSPDNCFPAKEPERIDIKEESLIRSSPIEIWVEANGTSRCVSEKTNVTLKDIIKYENPHNVTVQWSQDNLTLQWVAPEKHQAAVEIRHRKDSNQLWNELHRKTTDVKDGKYDLTVVNLDKPSVQQLQMRQQSTKAKSPLWSEWSNILTVPIEFVRISKRLMNGTRRVKLRWKPVPSPDGEAVLYQVETQSFKGCPCHKHQDNTSKTLYYTFGSYSALDISVKAINSASFSPPALFHVRPENPPNLKVCEGTLLNKTTKGVCSEWYELRDGIVKEDTVTILASTRKSKKEKQKIEKELKDYLPYVYFEHRCINKKTQRTEKMCLYYKTQEKPDGHPKHFITSAESPTSVTLSWEPIPTEGQRGFITHYSLCITRAGTEGLPDCRNISASLKSYTVEKLTPGTKYNISLKGFTSVGEGPPARITINTQHEKPYSVWLSLGLLIGFFLLSILCTFVFARIKNKILPPVPVPVIPEFTANYHTEVQDLLERKEERHEVTLVPLHPEFRPPEDTAKQRPLSGTPDEGSSDLEEEVEDKDQSSNALSEEDDRALKGLTEESTDLVQNEIALLIYRNGLVFDVNVDSS